MILRFPAIITAVVLAATAANAAPRPNIVVILADDLGYSDISPYGGELTTPNLQALAAKGLRFRNFYNTARCCPSRASLLTGLSPHEAGIGHMTSEDSKQESDVGDPHYEGFLNRECVTLAEALKAAGYRTLMAGKWHVGTFRGMWPKDRGFDRFYGIIRGASNYYQPGREKLLTFDDTPVDLASLPKNFYTTEAFTDHAIDFVNEAAEKHPDQPFFLYLAYTSPHWPLQVPEKYVAPRRKFYERGWDVLRPERLKGVIEAGVVSKDTRASAAVAPPWNSLAPAKRAEMVERMSIYAGMIEAMDENIGRLMKDLAERGLAENTLVIFLSDNGACAEGGMLGSGDAQLLGTRQGYFLTLGEAWANYANIPLDKYKHFTREGGIRTPCIVSWPNGIKSPGGWTDQVGSIIDLMPTVLDLAQSKYPKNFEGHELLPLAGKSLVPTLAGGAPTPRTICFEHEGNKAIIDGDWKLVATFGQRWTLHNLQKDPTELIDLSSAEPDRVKTMAKAWQVWADRVGVLPWPIKRKLGYTPPPREYPVQLP